MGGSQVRFTEELDELAMNVCAMGFVSRIGGEGALRGRFRVGTTYGSNDQICVKSKSASIRKAMRAQVREHDFRRTYRRRGSEGQARIGFSGKGSTEREPRVIAKCNSLLEVSVARSASQLE